MRDLSIPTKKEKKFMEEIANPIVVEDFPEFIKDKKNPTKIAIRFMTKEEANLLFKEKIHKDSVAHVAPFRSEEIGDFWIIVLFPEFFSAPKEVQVDTLKHEFCHIASKNAGDKNKKFQVTLKKKGVSSGAMKTTEGKWYLKYNERKTKDKVSLCKS